MVKLTWENFESILYLFECAGSLPLVIFPSFFEVESFILMLCCGCPGSGEVGV